MKDKRQIFRAVSPLFRGSYVHLDEPHKANEDADPRYSVMLVFDEDKDSDFIAELEQMVEDVAIQEWGEVPRKLKTPLKTADDLDDDNFAGKVCLNASSDRQPGLRHWVSSGGKKKQEDFIGDVGEEFYSGAWFRASIRAYAWSHKTGGKGVSFALDNILKMKDDEPFTSKVSAADDFADIDPMDDDDDKPARGRKSKSTKTAKPASRGRVKEDDDEDDEDGERASRNRNKTNKPAARGRGRNKARDDDDDEDEYYDDLTD